MSQFLGMFEQIGGEAFSQGVGEITVSVKTLDSDKNECFSADITMNVKFA